jgi:hypothetical protein
MDSPEASAKWLADNNAPAFADYDALKDRHAADQPEDANRRRGGFPYQLTL